MKNKLIASVEIAIVLCSMFLVALPAIAATQTMQTITTASEDDYVLGVYGNANEDDTIDMRDLTYVKLIFFGKKPETELADAKYDGKINPLDFIQIKLIIVGKEKEITIVDANGDVETIHKPVKRIVVLYKDTPEVLRTLSAMDKIVGVSDYIKQYDHVFLLEISKLPCVGLPWNPDYEAILNLHPDVLLAFASVYKETCKEKLPGVKVIFLGLRCPEHYTNGVKKLGYILDKEEEAEELLQWREGWLNKIKERTEKLSEDDKPRVFNTPHASPKWNYRICCKDANTYQMTVIAGGKDIVENLDRECGYRTTVDAEWLIEQNPEIIVAQAYYERTDHGYNTDDPSEMAAARGDIMNLPVLADVNAVKNRDVYMMAGNFRNGGDGNIIGTAYMAKWFHPDIFEDLDPQVIHQEYLTRFQQFDFNVYEHGVFEYPPLED